ncbi:PaaI family thioesterase [Pelotalea chapellei]|uniref:PaaI family thioesterase n=1 Tax=Pelotalea chapellei TaxID=44671 RepID=A0ABS5U5J1_9BACT|nr:PaaI family thioesterase [Pelotalea chapellei]MBT1070917.1 PaaI family thioesterase [Pelotalea chapellei]
MYENIYDQLMVKDAQLPFALPEWIAVAPFEEYLGMRIEQAGNGQAVLTMPFKAALCQGGGLMHGGAVVSLADTALAMAIKTILPEGSLFATIEMGLIFHAPVRWGTVRAEARVIETRERDIVGGVEVITEEGIKAATFKATFRVKREKEK